MSLANRLDDFIKQNETEVFIEAEGRPGRLKNFYSEYNAKYSPTISNATGATGGIIVLEEDANKWGLELRLYLNHKPDFVQVTKTATYRNDYPYRINDTKLIQELFDLGYRIGLNRV